MQQSWKPISDHERSKSGLGVKQGLLVFLFSIDVTFSSGSYLDTGLGRIYWEISLCLGEALKAEREDFR
jgi:hypothetical protein